MSSRLSHPSTRPRPHPSGQKAWSVTAKDEPTPSDTKSATILLRIDETGCGPLLGAPAWHPSLLAVDPKSHELFVAELGQPRIKVFDKNGKYLRNFAMSGGVECLCVIPGEAIVIVVTEDIKVSKMLGLKKESHRIVNATVRPFLDFKPGFEFTVKSRYVVDKKAARPLFSIVFDETGSRFLVTDSTSNSVRAFSASNGSHLWEKPRKPNPKEKVSATPTLLKPLGIAVDKEQNIYVCDSSTDNPAVKVFDKNVQLMYLLGEGRGTGDANMMMPCDVVYHSPRNLLLIADTQRNCVSAYATDSAGVASMSWRFTFVVHGEPLWRQACVSDSTPTAEGPVSIALSDDESLWVAYPSISTIFKAKWNN